jgi:hypothetical protein
MTYGRLFIARIIVILVVQTYSEYSTSRAQTTGRLYNERYNSTLRQFILSLRSFTNWLSVCEHVSMQQQPVLRLLHVPLTQDVTHTIIDADSARWQWSTLNTK